MKRITSFILVILMLALVFTSCAKTETPTKAPEESTATSEPAKENAPAEEKKEEPKKEEEPKPEEQTKQENEHNDTLILDQYGELLSF